MQSCGLAGNAVLSIFKSQIFLQDLPAFPEASAGKTGLA
jgi:hypothetical protein